MSRRSPNTFDHLLNDADGNRNGTFVSLEPGVRHKVTDIEAMIEPIEESQMHPKPHKEDARWLRLLFVLTGMAGAGIFAFCFSSAAVMPNCEHTIFAANLSAICGVDTGQLEAPAACQHACQTVSCCLLDIETEGSCAQQELCLDYGRYCHPESTASEYGPTLPSTTASAFLDDKADWDDDDDDDEDIDVPPASSSTDKNCAEENLVTSHGMRQCAGLCIRYRCCYDDSVRACYNENCFGYASCKNLLGHGREIP